MTSCRLALRLGAAILASSLGAGLVRADEACFAPAGLDSPGPLSLRTVSAAPRATFIKTETERKGCPGSAASCQDKAYVVTGDVVLITAEQGGRSCATFVSPKGADHTGWLRSSDLKPLEPAPADRAADWAGAWTAGPEQNLAIKAKPDGVEISIDGSATYGAQDPDRVKRGAVNMGDFSASATPSNFAVAFTTGMDGKTLPYDKGDPTDCRLRMRRVGPYLVVDDSGNCGGMNVTFSAIYRRT